MHPSLRNGRFYGGLCIARDTGNNPCLSTKMLLRSRKYARNVRTAALAEPAFGSILEASRVDYTPVFWKEHAKWPGSGCASDLCTVVYGLCSELASG